MTSTRKRQAEVNETVKPAKKVRAPKEPSAAAGRSTPAQPREKPISAGQKKRLEKMVTDMAAQR
eukprot:4346433-Pyramimonas_sp.AAC.1